MCSPSAETGSAFCTGPGAGCHQLHLSLFEGTERFFRPGYVAHLVHQGILAFDGVEAVLESARAKGADVGCERGVSWILLDLHSPSLSHEGQRAFGAGGEARPRDVAAAGGFDHLTRVKQTPFNMNFQAPA